MHTLYEKLLTALGSTTEETMVQDPTVAYNTGTESTTEVQQLFKDPYAITSMIKQGVPYHVFEQIKKTYPLSGQEWAELIHISYKTLQRYEAKEAYTFKENHSERILAITEVLDYGLYYFDDPENFRRWLDTPSFALGDSKPLDLLTNSFGRSLVLNELVHLEHGIFV